MGVKRKGLATELLAHRSDSYHLAWTSLWDTAMPEQLLARCKPLQPLNRPGGGRPAETFQDLFEKMTEMAVTNSNNQLPLPTNNYPKIPRKKKQKKSSSKRLATSNTSRLGSAPAIVVSQSPPKHGENQPGLRNSVSRNTLLNDELRNNHRAKIPFNFVS